MNEAEKERLIKKDVESIENMGLKESCSEIPNKWIPVSERLPKDSGDYLTTTMYGEVCCDYWTGINFDRQEVVIAWQPLPKPYKAESEDKE